ncbi:MAG: histidine phosphatase family protein [Betaproteobacteria bacterium]|nr:histidine phosphatase family protein [Betaproteobacteria bacterium]
MRTRRIFSLGLAIGLAISPGLPSVAQQTIEVAHSERVLAASELNTRDPEIIQRAFQNPKIVQANALSGAALLQALRQGGFVLYMRHTQTGTITQTCNVTNLTMAGARDARFIGESMRKLRIPIDRVLSSPICRVLDTARLLGLGEIEVVRGLSNDAGPERFDLSSARAALIAETPKKGTSRMLVSHTHAGPNPASWMQLDFGEIIVYRPGTSNGGEPIARIRADDWYTLLALDEKK